MMADEDVHDTVLRRIFTEDAARRRILRTCLLKELAKLKHRGRLQKPIKVVAREIEDGLVLAWTSRDMHRQALAGERHWTKDMLAYERSRSRVLTEHGLRYATRVFIREKLSRKNIGAERALKEASVAEFSELSPKDRRAVEQLALKLQALPPTPRPTSDINEQWIAELCHVIEAATGSTLSFSRSGNKPTGPYFRIVRAAVEYFGFDDYADSKLKDETIAAYLARCRPRG